MLRASLVISTVIVSALSAAATVFVLTPKATNNPDIAVVESTPQLSPAARPNATTVESAAASDSDISTLKRELDTLRQQLDDAEAERGQLAETVVSLNRQVADLESSTLNLASLASQQTTNAETNATLPTNPRSGSGNNFRVPVQATAESRYESLLAAGVDVTAADDITERQNRYQLDRLELSDLATREGWIDTDQYRQRLEELATERVDLREELGEETYDAYLYNAGSSNRVLIESIIPGSAADAAGAQAGDLIMSYASMRVYRVRDLQQATRSGSRGELVDLTVDRQGQLLTLSVPRGPLGVTLDGLRISP